MVWARRFLMALPAILAVSLLSCGGGQYSNSSPNPQSPDLTGNWQSTGTSSVHANQQTTVIGSISQTGTQVSGMLTLFGPCFSDMMGSFTGTLQGSTLNLISSAISGQVVTISATVDSTGSVITGTYSAQGGCAGGDQGSFSGNKIPALNGNWTAQFAGASGLSFSLRQTTPDATTGFYSIAGSASSSSSPVCFAGSATGNIAGTDVSMVVSGGDIFTTLDQYTFQGKIDLSGSVITGSYSGLSGNCAGLSGSATLTKQ